LPHPGSLCNGSQNAEKGWGRDGIRIVKYGDMIREAINHKNPVKLGTLSKVACHPPLPTEVGMHMRRIFRWANTPQ
jgi:hypothetical protein